MQVLATALGNSKGKDSVAEHAAVLDGECAYHYRGCFRDSVADQRWDDWYKQRYIPPRTQHINKKVYRYWKLVPPSTTFSAYEFKHFGAPGPRSDTQQNCGGDGVPNDRPTHLVSPYNL
jgi:hypothetical protein